jgi:hypothetical protein
MKNKRMHCACRAGWAGGGGVKRTTEGPDDGRGGKVLRLNQNKGEGACQEPHTSGRLRADSGRDKRGVKTPSKGCRQRWNCVKGSRW